MINLKFSIDDNKQGLGNCMDKAYLDKLDLSEEKRVNEQITEISKNESKSLSPLFKNKNVALALEKGNQSLLSCYDEILPNIVPFSEHVFMKICPTCWSDKSPSVLMPYLERNLIIPILQVPYSYYSPKVIETLLNYPHLSFYEYKSAKKFVLSKKGTCLPDAQVDSLNSRIISNFDKAFPSLKDTSRQRVDSLFSRIEPFLYPDSELLFELLKSVQAKDINKYKSIQSISYLVNSFRNGQAFSLIPQVSIENVDALEFCNISNIGQIDFEVSDIRNNIMNGLKLSYNPALPLESYLDIVVEKRRVISNIVSRILKTPHADNIQLLSTIQAEIQRINYEAEKLQSSTKAMTLDLFTNFATGNKSIIAGFVMAASMGVGGLGLLGCSAGIATGIGGKVLSTKVDIQVPKISDKLKDRVSTFIEPSAEKILAKTLSTDINTIQVWQVRKRLNKIKKGS